MWLVRNTNTAASSHPARAIVSDWARRFPRGGKWGLAKIFLYVPENRDLNNTNVLWAIKELCKMFDIPFCRERCMRISVNILRQSVTSLNVIYDIWPNFAWVSDYNFFSLLYMHCIVMNLTIICGFLYFVLTRKKCLRAVICILHQLQWENDLFVSRDFVRDRKLISEVRNDKLTQTTCTWDHVIP